MAEKTITGGTSNIVTFADRLMLGWSRHWLLVAGLGLGLWVLLPWLAPVLMVAGLEGGADLIYKIYSVQCHQLPERSYFLFGSQLMYSMDDINAVWPYPNYFQLRQFVGTPEMGYKVAWSDRMVSFYTPLFIGTLFLALARWRSGKGAATGGAALGWRPLPIVWWLLALAPIFIDGVTHLMSDAISFGSGFRYTNAWLATLTGGAFAPTFYAGDAIGSFNWWMRLLTGLLAGFAMVWLFYPHLENGFVEIRQSLEIKLHQGQPADVELS